MNKGTFITGTDTGVGKTYVAAGIAALLLSRGIKVGVMKPVETGCRMRSGRLIPSDAFRLMNAASAGDSLSLVNPYRFSRPLAPSVAAEMEGKKIDVNKILRSYRTLSGRHEFMIVEGAGGIMVPLSQDYLYLDLASALGLPVVIVARPGLGTINHTLLTITALRSKGIAISGIVMNFSEKGKTGLAEKTSHEVIQKISGVRVFGIVRFGSIEFNDIVDAM